MKKNLILFIILLYFCIIIFNFYKNYTFLSGNISQFNERWDRYEYVIKTPDATTIFSNEIFNFELSATSDGICYFYIHNVTEKEIHIDPQHLQSKEFMTNMSSFIKNNDNELKISILDSENLVSRNFPIILAPGHKICFPIFQKSITDDEDFMGSK